MNEIRRFLHYFNPYKLHVFGGILFILCGMAFGLYVPWLVGNAVDDFKTAIFNETLTVQRAATHALLILSVNLISGMFLFWQRRLLINASRYIEYDMRRDFYEAIVDQPLNFFQENRVGDLMARATNDLSAVRQIVGPMILYSFQAVFALCIVIPVMISINLKLTLLLLIPMPLVTITVKVLGQQVHVRFEKIQEYFSDITARAQENLSGVRVVRAYARENSEIEQFQQLNREYSSRNVALVKYSAAMRPLLYFFIGLGFVIIVAVGVPMAIRGEITAGNFTSFILYLQRMIWYLIALGYVVNLYQRGTASLKRFNAILETVPAIADKENVEERAPIKGAVEFRNVNFGFGEKQVLKGIDLSIKPGQTVGFVGKTGCGKSTLISLIPRLHEVTDGEILIDGVSVREYPLAQLRRSIGFVQQETFLFSSTIAQNIAFGEPYTGKGPSDEQMVRVKKAAEIAGLGDDIEKFPDKFDQMVGERGITLSGGQKQRTSIARAVMRDPQILILDDCLSAVDTYTEETILKNLSDVRRNRTTLIVAHRISTIRDADVICVLHNGEITEKGSHDELLKLNGEYAELYERQLLEDEINAEE